MLNIIRSNKIETLSNRLALSIANAPLSSPFAPEIVVVPSLAMARWVNLQLAERHGVAANLRYPLPAAFVWQVARDVLEDRLPERDPFDIDVLVWKIFGALPKLVQYPAFASPRNYLGDDPNDLKRLQLASRIADAFDRYQLYRPELIREWEAGGEDDWQALLWRRLTSDPTVPHRVAVIDRVLRRLHESESRSIAVLPERVTLFAISSLPPLLVDAMRALALHTQVDLYVHAPTDAFWADLVSQKKLADIRLMRPGEADLWEVGNDLLASWGRQGQALQDLLLNGETPIDGLDLFDEPDEDTLLGRLQRDIFELQSVPAHEERSEVAADDSVQVHVCHSALRECQVLHDNLLRMLEADRDLRPEDILVMIPEIGAYAPYIEAVFRQDSERGRRFVPWNLSDISARGEHPLVGVFLRFLALPESRFSRSEIFSYLDVAELAGHFGLNDEAVAQVKTSLSEANLRWGLDGDHKQQLRLPEIEENTWAQAEQRLFAGYALGESDALPRVAPIANVEGADAEALGKFWRLFSKLSDAATRLATPCTAVAWQARIGALLNDFFGERDDEDGRLRSIRDAAAELAEQTGGLDEELSPALVRHWLEQRLSMEHRHGRYFNGGVTFCGMRPMRSLPFKVICALGLHDQAFPRRERPSEFDRMRERWRPGDPHKGHEDRFLFLETLLCARRRLYLGYVGRDIRKNTELQPSVLVSELLDYIDQHYRVAGGTDEDKVSNRLTTVHPLQPFSPRNYTPGAESYDTHWCAVANDLRRPPDRKGGSSLNWPDTCMSDPPDRMREVTLEQLERFLRHPIKYLVNSRLRLYLREEEPEDDDERFALNHLQSFFVKQRLVEDRLRGRVTSQTRLSAEGDLPHGAFAEVAFEEESEKVVTLVERLANYAQLAPNQIPVDLTFDGPFRLTGQVKGIYPGFGLLRWRPGRLRGGDILGLWLSFLAWCACSNDEKKPGALHTADQSYVINKTLGPDDARRELAGYLDCYWDGVHRPLPVLPKASYVYALKRHCGGRGDPLNAARDAWNGNSFTNIPGDKDDIYVQLALRGVAGDPIADDGFAALAIELYDRALRTGELT